MSDTPAPSEFEIPAAIKECQRTAYLRLCEFISPKQRSAKFFRLSGSAGTGKTHVLGVLAGANPSLFFIGTAPTNKATKLLRTKLNKPCKTIYSLLGISMEAEEDKLVLKFPSKPADLRRWDVIIVDEGSMLNAELVDYIKKIAALYPSIKWIISGDREQINPVGEESSAIWSLQAPSARLTKVVRHDNKVLTLATHVRDQVVAYPDYDLRVATSHGKGAEGGVWRVKGAKFHALIDKAAKAGKFHEVDNTKVIAWTNAAVAEYNEAIRVSVNGKAAYHSRWLVGDRVMVASPAKRDGHIIATIDDEGTVVESNVVAHHTFFKELKCYYLVVAFDEGPALELTVIHEDSETDLVRLLNNLAAEAKKDKKKWGAFWALKESFHSIRHSFAITAHRSQGSTYRSCFVDMYDITRNRNKQEALRCLYVAISRATTNVIIT